MSNERPSRAMRRSRTISGPVGGHLHHRRGDQEDRSDDDERDRGAHPVERVLQREAAVARLANGQRNGVSTGCQPGDRWRCDAERASLAMSARAALMFKVGGWRGRS